MDRLASLSSFKDAARQLRVTPSIITRSVADLEGRLGLVLLNRTTRSVRLTERGQIFLESCRQILEDIEGAERTVRGENAEPRGSLKVAAPTLFGRLRVLPIITRLLTRHPGLSIHLTLSDRNVHLAEESVDVAVRIRDLADSSMKPSRVGSVSHVLVASPAYLERRGTPKAPRDVSAHDIIAFESLDATNKWRFGSVSQQVRVEPRLTVNSADAAMAAAEADLGISRTLLSGDGECALWPPSPAAGQFHCRKAFGQRDLPCASHRPNEPHNLHKRLPRILPGAPVGPDRGVGDPDRQRRPLPVEDVLVALLLLPA